MPRFLQYLFGLLIASLVIGAPIGYAYHRQANVRNFRVVHERILYRSSQMSIPALRDAVHDYGIKTVVTLRDSYVPDNPPPDLAEEKYCKAEEINYYRISPRSWWAPDGSVPADDGVRRFVEIMKNKDNYPVLIHCFAGIHRTGAFCAIYRMEFDHWTNAHAITELRACGYRDLEDEWDLLDYLKMYEPSWKKETGDGPKDLAAERGRKKSGAASSW
jgi:tyrosine-protein phosphatase SIW14